MKIQIKKWMSLCLGTLLVFNAGITTVGAIEEQSNQNVSKNILEKRDTVSEEVKKSEKETDISQSSSEETGERVFYNGQWIELQEQPEDIEKETPVITEENQNILGQKLQSNIMSRSARAETSYNPADRSKPPVDFVDVASYQGDLSRNDYENMKKYGVRGVVVKLTEGTTYKNPNARNQITNAKAAGLKVSAYHFSWFTSKAQAEAEADFFAKVAKELGLDANTVMVNDAENSIMNNGFTTDNSVYFALRLIRYHGFNSVIHYSYANWFNAGVLDKNKLDCRSTWIAQYPYEPSRSNLLHRDTSGWQWTSQIIFPEISGKRFDSNVDYLGYFINPNIAPPVLEKPSGKVTVEDIGNQNTTIKLTYKADKGIGNTKSVWFPTWTDGTGQRWYSAEQIANDTWTVNVPISDFKKAGKYFVHCYTEDYEGIKHKNSEASFFIDSPKILEVTSDKMNVENGEFNISTKVQSKSPLQSVKVAIWSEANQGNLKWYDATRNGDTWHVNANILNHKNKTGDYFVHVYAYPKNGIQTSGELSGKVKVQALEKIPMHRLYNVTTGEHFYTGSTAEKDFLVSKGWKYEKIGWTAPTSGDPVYRMYNLGSGEHHYTKSEVEKNFLLKNKWQYEGVGWYSGGSKEIFRFYNPKLKGPASHHYTLSKDEKVFLEKNGWIYEGIGWNGY